MEFHVIPALFSSGTQAAMIVRAPFIIPDAPIPATALPTINIFDEVATPQSNDPNSKSARKEIKVYFD